jgi:hypothetical protein
MHWTLGGPAPSACRYGRPAQTLATSPQLHVALQTSELQGWVGLAFPRDHWSMVPADGIIGYMSEEGRAVVSPYFMKVGSQGCAAGCCCTPVWQHRGGRLGGHGGLGLWCRLVLRGRQGLLACLSHAGCSAGTR